MSTFDSPLLFHRRRDMPAASNSGTPAEQPTTPAPPTVTVEEVEDDQDQDNQDHDNQEDDIQEDQEAPEGNQPEITGQETLLQPPGDQPRASTSRTTESSTIKPPPEFTTFAKVFGKAILQLVEEQDVELTGEAKKQQELITTHASEDLPISAFIKMTLKEDAGKQDRVAGITPGYW